MTVFDSLQKQFELKASLVQLREQLAEEKSRIPQLTFRQREAQEAVWAAESGFRKLLNRLSGKGQEEQEEAEGALRAARAELEQAQRIRTALEERIVLLEEEVAALGDPDALMAALTESERGHILRLQAKVWAEETLQSLKKCRAELEQAQYYARNPMLQPESQRQEDIYKAKAGAQADKCREKLEAISGIGFPLEIHPYLQNPMGYIVTARRFGDQDQMNKAQAALRDTEKMLKELILQ